jgi:hypothetical protein
VTRRERQILERMKAGAFIWLVDGRRWPYPALCYGKTCERITRVMLENLCEKRWITEVLKERVFSTGSWDISDAGKAALQIGLLLPGV